MDAVLQDDLLGRMVETDGRQPAPVRQRPIPALADLPVAQLTGVMEGMTKALEAAGIMSALIIPHGIEMMKMRPVDPAKARALDRGQRVKQAPGGASN